MEIFDSFFDGIQFYLDFIPVTESLIVQGFERFLLVRIQCGKQTFDAGDLPILVLEFGFQAGAISGIELWLW
jgi:hypothetical protein